MDQISTVKHQIKLSEWSKVIAACQSSGMTVIDWCKTNNISYKAYYYWLRRVREAALEASGMKVPEPPPEKPVEFRKLKVDTPPMTKAAVIIRLPGASIEVSNGATRETIEAVLLALGSV